LPVGLACALLQIPFVLHDSDTVPGIANRLIAPFAAYITTGFPSTGFRKQKERVYHVGIPIRVTFFQALEKSRTIKNSDIKPLLFITGGSLGAQRLNQIITETKDELSRIFDIIHVVGADNINSFQSQTGYKVLPFVTDDYASYLKKAAIVIVRGGSTSIAEIAVAGSACIVIPNSFLYDQVENSKLLEKNNAAVVVDEIEAADDPELLISAISKLYADPSRQKQLHDSLAIIFPRDASYRIAQLLLAYLV
jgi:UDP-N-acetylglucosamine--N-acetylmuramyl-(pentapeptide) pyrophosphoryl-undecaprenol N-acetylglucosamine transferase